MFKIQRSWQSHRYSEVTKTTVVDLGTKQIQTYILEYKRKEIQRTGGLKVVQHLL